MKIYKQDEIDELADIIKNDGVISVPTDTVYGVCARISSKNAFDNLMKTKNRPSNKAFPIMCADKEQIESVAIINKTAKCLIKNFMPGPITLVLNKKQDLPEYITSGKNTIAVRMATSESIKKLIERVGCPLFMSSANQSGEPTCTTIEEISKSCPTLYGIMEGKVYFGESSTIVDCTSNEIKILREGPITIDQIQNALKEVK